jgi:hypothetical protein
MTAILQFLSGTFAIDAHTRGRRDAVAEPPRAQQFCAHRSDLPAARDDDAWIRADWIRMGRIG